MATPLQQRMLASASAYPALVALLGSSPFRWYYDVLQQGSAYPAVVVQQISGSNTYTAAARLKTGFSRFQFMIWGGQFATGAQARDDVQAALTSWLDQWSGGSGIPGLSLYSNRVIGQRESVFVLKDSPVYQKALDVMIFADDTL